MSETVDKYIEGDSVVSLHTNIGSEIKNLMKKIIVCIN